mmetsp:Transcript_22996/g.34296  ORF Transcript_22996/g.34296 Transcript_22996/m.34296 type:complete len:291 (-) Transcript_22996:66-938(-)
MQSFNSIDAERELLVYIPDESIAILTEDLNKQHCNMRRSSPQKLPTDSRLDIEQGNSAKKRINPVRNLDPEECIDPEESNNRPTIATAYYSSPFSPSPPTNHNNTNQSPLQKFITSLLPTILKDTLLGVSLGVLFLLTLFFLDYKNFISTGSTKAFQTAGVQLLSDPEVVTTIESSLDVKLVPLDSYTAMTAEIQSNRDLLTSDDGTTSLLTKYNTQLSQVQAEIDSLKEEHEVLSNEMTTKFGLDKWCGECKGGWGKCDARVEYLRSTYGNNVILSKVDIMKEGLCLKN